MKLPHGSGGNIPFPRRFHEIRRAVTMAECAEKPGGDFEILTADFFLQNRFRQFYVGGGFTKVHRKIRVSEF